MDHEELKEKIHGFYDGELSEKEAARVENHLQNCVECGRELEEWRRVASVFFKPGPSANTEAFITRVMARLEDNTTPSFLRWVWGWPAPALALGVLTFALIGTLPQENSTPTLTELLSLNGEAEPASDHVLTFALEE